MDQQQAYAEIYQRRDKFRAVAGRCATHARKMLESADERALIYATLEVRFALEALVYELACNYTEELGTAPLDWQPTKVLERLVEIDPHAEQTVYIKMPEPDAEGVSEYQDNRLDLRKLKKRYYKLGNVLHAPMDGDLESSRGLKGDKLRQFCTESLAVVEKVLASTAMVIVPGHRPIFEVDCACGEVIRRRTDPLFVHREDPTKGASSITVACSNCAASWQVSLNGDSFEVLPDEFGFLCPHPACGKQNTVWQGHMVDGKEVDCGHCRKPIRFTNVLFPMVVEQ